MIRLLPARSLAVRALLLGLINASAVIAIAMITMGLAYRRSLIAFLQAPVRERIVSTSRRISLDLIENDSESWNALLERDAKGTPFQFVLLDSNGDQVAGHPMQIPEDVLIFAGKVNTQLSYSPKFDLKERMELQNSAGYLLLERDRTTKFYWAGVHVLIHFPEDQMYGHGTLVWRFPSLWTNSYLFNLWPYVALLVGSVLVTALCWMPAAGAVLRRISVLMEATGEIAKGNFNSPLPTESEDEVGRLTGSIASMSRQMSALLTQQQRFVSDAAHELLSPISRVQIALELLHQKIATRVVENEEEREAAEAYFRDLSEDVEDISEIVQNLLFYSRSRSKEAPVNRLDLDLEALVRSVVRRESFSDEQVLIRIPSGLHVYASEPHLKRALANLLRNSRQHAGVVGKVEVAAYREGDDVHVLIRDEGPGIPESDLSLVFAPFYRVELARSRQTGGTGLGLAIVQSSIETCGGTVCCRNRHPKGLEVEMILPGTADKQETARPSETLDAEPLHNGSAPDGTYTSK